MPLMAQVLQVLDEGLSLNGRSASFGPQTRLSGAVPEFDSMAMLTVLEDSFGVVVQDGDINDDILATAYALVQFVASKLDA